MKPYERESLLERIEREGATVGAGIPEAITVQGKPMALQEFVFETRKRERLPADAREEVERAKKNLRRERLQRKQRVENGEITVKEGEELVASIVGIDRALNALNDLAPIDLEREVEAKEAADRKRWMNFLKQALGRDSGRTYRP